MTLTTLRTDARYLVSPQLTSTAYGDTDLDRNGNHWYRMAVGWILESMGWNWEYNLQFSTTDLVSGQREYVLPTALMRLKRVEIKYAGSDQYVKATIFDDLNTDQALGNATLLGATESQPLFRVGDRSLFIYPSPTANSTAGLRIESVEDLTDLTLGSDLPEMPAVLHRIFSVGAAHDYAVSKEMWNKAEKLERMIYGKPGVSGTGLKYQLESLYSRRENSEKPVMRVRKENYN